MMRVFLSILFIGQALLQSLPPGYIQPSRETIQLTVPHGTPHPACGMELFFNAVISARLLESARGLTDAFDEVVVFVLCLTK